MSVNKVILIGNLGKDPELRKTGNDQSVCSFSLCTNEKYTDKQGNKKESTEWHNIVTWAGLADNCAKYLEKGRQVYIEGKVTTNSWEDKDGNKRYRTEIVAREVKFLGTNGNTSDTQSSGDDDLPFDTN